MDSNKFYSFYMKGWDEPCLGIIQSIGDEWILIKRIINDYLFDGYTFIRRKYIQKVNRDSNIIFKEKVLYAKGYIDQSLPLTICLNKLSTPLDWICEKKCVCMISPKDETLCYITSIEKILKRYLILHAMTFEGCWETKNFKYLISEIVTIDFDNDYINSLVTYNRMYLSGKDD
ncbi:hypothetical protein [Bacteroides sp.]|uniref:hypothetical protein n=1 Tax=Bacteroides sp. TaxID=29523 RepID=UPI0025BBD50C|nr:hypothetical protein [Bacteroides sp.]